VNEFEARGAEVIDLILEETGPSGYLHSAPVPDANVIPVTSSSSSLERPTKQQKRHHGMIDISPEKLGDDGSAADVHGNVSDYRQVSASTQDNHDQSQHPHAGYYPEHFASYSDDYHANNNGGYSGNYHNNMQYPYWNQNQQQQHQYYNNNHNNEAQHMSNMHSVSSQDMSNMQQQSNYYQHYQQTNGGNCSGFPTPYPYDQQGMYGNDGTASAAQQSMGIVTSESAGNLGNNSITSYPRNQGGWGNTNNSTPNNNESVTNDPFDYQGNIDCNVYNS